MSASDAPAVLPRVDPGAGLQQLISLYTASERALQDAIRSAALRHADGTAAYYRGQLIRIQAELAQLQRQAVPLARATVEHAYIGSAAAVDQVLETDLGAFTGINRNAINRLAQALAVPLQRMSLTVGRQAMDAYRQAGLQETATGIATGRTRIDTSRAIARRLADQGVTGFVDRSGRRWKMSTYASMVARTTTREATSQGMADRLQGHGGDLVTIDDHESEDDLCNEYAGQTFSLTGNTPGYPVLDDLPPFHPNCTHVAYPAACEFDDWLSALGV